jgi:response regulator RpfG family c-di-GMP phosphodiesterase
MAEKRVVVVCGDRQEFDWICRELSISGVRPVCGVTDVEDLAPIVDDVGVGLVLVVRGRASDTTAIARVLWHVSRSRRPMPVMVLAGAYDEADALLCLQMGVADYLGRADHRAWLGRIVAELVQPVRTTEDAAVEVGEAADRPVATASRVKVVSPSRV